MTSRTRLGFLISCGLALALAACGGDDSAGGGISPASCNAQCDAQDHAEGGCAPLVDNKTCKELCKGLAQSLPKDCSDELDAYYSCSANDGFTCSTGFVTPKTNACDDEEAAFEACQNGGSAGSGGGAGSGGNSNKCAGARSDGFCPQVACPCPEGTKMVSGFDNDASGCKCWDTNTCKDLTCD